MARYDPRYNYPVGYGLGTAALGLADILGQGFDRYHRQSQDELGQQNQQQNYLLKLQELLASEQDRTAARQQTATDRTSALERAGTMRTNTNQFYRALAGQSGATLPDVQDPSSLDPTALKFALEQLVPKVKAPPVPPSTIAPGHGVLNPQGGYDVPVPLAEKPPTPSLERDYHAIAAKSLPPGASDADIAAEARRLRQEDAVATSAAQGENAQRMQFQPADGPPRPVQPTLPSSAALPGVMDRNPDFREGGGLSVPKGSSVDLAVQRDLMGRQPTTMPTGETVIERKTRLADEAALGVKQRTPVGEGAAHYVLKTTGLPPPPDMPVQQVQKDAVAVTQQQMQSLGAARRGLSIIRQFEDPKLQSLFPENPTEGKGLLGVLANAARAQSFGTEARIRGKSDPEYAKLITAFATAIPALAKATGEVGNLSELEQQVVKDAIGITRTREAFKAGIDTYRQILERGFKANGIPVPQELRGAGDSAAPAAPGQAQFRWNPATRSLEPVQ